MASSIQIASFVEPGFGENAYVLWVNAKGPCWIIDPGPDPSAPQILEHIREHGLTPEAILLTHGHIDHIAGIPTLLKTYADLPVYIAEEEKAALTEPRENLSTTLGQAFSTGVTESRNLRHGSEMNLDGSAWRILDTSGHSPGGRSFHCPESAVVFTGDALFQLSIGRTDFPHSNGEQLLSNIRKHLFALPDDTTVYSGHGPATTIGDEKQFNPFLQDS